ncbi:MAG TPA: hypothetical protein VHD57_09915 [Vicinamibacterales bacterium]|jgi:hypothetical protein|nr:hypothetical protein [Vicinamibacterales bacterium]
MAAHEDQDTYELALQAKIAAWQTALDAYRAAKAADGGAFVVHGSGGSQNSTVRPPHGYDLPVGALRGHTLPDAIKVYLEAGNRKQTNKEIATGIRAAGFETGQANLEAGVASALFRLKKAGTVLRFKEGWDLATHYSDHLRKKLETTPVKRGAKPKTASSNKAAQSSTPEPEKPV